MEIVLLFNIRFFLYRKFQKTVTSTGEHLRAKRRYIWASARWKETTLTSTNDEMSFDIFLNATMWTSIRYIHHTPFQWQIFKKSWDSFTTSFSVVLKQSMFLNLLVIIYCENFSQDDNYGTTPLHHAAQVGDSLVVK